jgi:beta-glucosidase
MTIAPTAFSGAVDRIRGGEPPDPVADDLLGRLTPDEKLNLLDGDVPFWDGLADLLAGRYNPTPITMGRIERLGIPGLRFSDGPRGVVMGSATAFPVSTARGATWDPGLEERVGVAIGLEARAQGANFFGGVCINLPRHPAWGRVQETYGEDPILLGEFGAALTRGVQRNAMAVAKHYALNSMENARFTVDVTADDAALHEVFLAHFRRVVEEGVSGIMTAYNSVNGEWAGQNEQLLEGVLRAEWDFKGVAVSDFIFGLRDAAKSLRAGLDVEEPFAQQRALRLPGDLASGRVSWQHVDRAARRILRTQLRFYATRDPAEPSAEVVFCAEHRGLAREVAARSMVLLKNDEVDGERVLPLDPDGLKNVALIGRLGDVANTGDHASSDVHSPEVVTPLQGLRAALPGASVRHVADDDPRAAAAAARNADAAIVLVGYTAADEGEYLSSSTFTDERLLATFPPVGDSTAGQELQAKLVSAGGGTETSILGVASVGGDRESLRLRPADVEIIRAVSAANPRTVVAIVTAGAVITEEWRDQVSAVLLSWYSGCAGGHALADVLLGRADPSGRLPFSIPTAEQHLPFFDRDATGITYDKWFGQRLLDRDGHAAAFPLGYGLSYTTFEFSHPAIGEPRDEHVDVSVTVTNTGTVPGRHVVQVYGCPRDAGHDFPPRVLLGFACVGLEPGESRNVTVDASTRPLQRWKGNGFVPASDTARIEIAAHSGDPNALLVDLTLITNS